MSKPVTGKTHVGERRERRPNGDVYLYERVTAYNEQARKSYTVSQKLKGKIKSGTQEVITTRPKKRKGEGIVACAVRRHSGPTDILECPANSVRSILLSGYTKKSYIQEFLLNTL